MKGSRIDPFDACQSEDECLSMRLWSQLCWVLLKFQTFNTRCVLETARITYHPAEVDLAENQLEDNLHHNHLLPTVNMTCNSLPSPLHVTCAYTCIPTQLLTSAQLNLLVIISSA